MKEARGGPAVLKAPPPAGSPAQSKVEGLALPGWGSCWGLVTALWGPKPETPQDLGRPPQAEPGCAGPAFGSEAVWPRWKPSVPRGLWALVALSLFGGGLTP